MPCVFESEHWVAAPIDRVFRFFADPRNLPLISPPSSGTHLRSLRLYCPNVAGESRSEELAGVGSEIELSFRLLPYFPVRSSWIARIIEFEWLDHIRDIQISGPFKRFDHRHSFHTEIRGGKTGTLIRDEVKYQLGFRPLGSAANVLIVRPMLSQMFTYRHAATERELGE